MLQLNMFTQLAQITATTLKRVVYVGARPVDGRAVATWCAAMVQRPAENRLRS